MGRSRMDGQGSARGSTRSKKRGGKARENSEEKVHSKHPNGQLNT